MHQLRSLALLFAVLLIGACARAPVQPLRIDHLPPQVELSNTPFHPQEDYQCGPAALATVLSQRGLDVAPEALTPKVFLPGREGSLQVELVAAARQQGMLVYPLQPKLESLLGEVAAGNPVLVLQNLGFSWWPQWHYAVVVGYDRTDRSVLLRSGTEKRQRLSLTNFDATWARGGRWAILTLPADRMPAEVEASRWLQAASDLEQTGQADAALRAYRSASQRWPTDPLTWFALGNNQYAAGQADEAEASLRRATQQMPPLPAAWNNLAHLLSERGCAAHAAMAFACARRLAPDDSRLKEPGSRADGDHCKAPPVCPTH